MIFNSHPKKKIDFIHDEISPDKVKEVLIELLDHLNLQVFQHSKNGHETYITLEPKEE